MSWTLYAQILFLILWVMLALVGLIGVIQNGWPSRNNTEIIQLPGQGFTPKPQTFYTGVKPDPFMLQTGDMWVNPFNRNEVKVWDDKIKDWKKAEPAE